MRLRGGFVAIVLAQVAMARGASAASHDVDVTWTAPSGCPDAATVRADVARLGGTARDGARAIATASTRDGKWHATIAIEDGDARRARTIHAKTCAELAEAAALVVAMALRDAPDPEPAPPPPSPPPPAPLPTEAPMRDARRVELPTGAFAIGAGIHGLAGALPSLASAAGGWIAWLPGRARLELSAYGTTAQSALAPGGTSGAELRMLGAAARACWIALASRRFGVGPCAGVEAFRVSSSGLGITSPRDAITWGSAGALGAHAYVGAFGPIAWTISADALAPIERPRFVLDGDPATVLHRPAAVWGRVLFGGEVRF